MSQDAQRLSAASAPASELFELILFLTVPDITTAMHLSRATVNSVLWLINVIQCVLSKVLLQLPSSRQKIGKSLEILVDIIILRVVCHQMTMAAELLC